MLFLKELLVVLLALAAASSGNKLGTETRIMGGTPVKDTADYPFMAFLSPHCGYISCTASIITPLWVLTTSNCVREPNSVTVHLPLHTFRVVAGEVNANQKNVCKRRGQLRFVAAIVFIHGDQRTALLKLTSKFEFGTWVKAVTFPPKGVLSKLPWEGKTCTMLGWGWGSEAKLFKVDLPVLKQEECIYNDEFKGLVFCTQAEGKGACTGDTGGPLMCDGVQAGLYVYRTDPNCSAPGRTEGYVRMDLVLDWIEQVIKKN